MDDTIKRHEMKDNGEEFNHDMRLENEYYEVEASKFNFHEVRLLFLICYLGGSSNSKKIHLDLL